MTGYRAQTGSPQPGDWAHPSEIPFRHGDAKRPALSDARRELNAGEFAAEVTRVAGGLAALGIGEGDVVATMLPNRTEIATVMFAAWQLGAAITPINPALGFREASYQLTDSKARLVIVDDTSATTLAGAAVEVLSVDSIPSLEGVPPQPVRAMDSLALLIYTSGTTGRPKGVMLDHTNVHAMLRMLIAHFQLTDTDRALVALPLFHVNGLVVSLLATLAVGGSTVILERFSKTTFWDDVERHRPTYFSLVPAMYLMFNALPARVQPDTSSLRFCICGAAPVPPDALRSFEARFGVPIVEAYGLSETTVGAAINPLDGLHKPGSVGPAIAGVEIMTVEADVPTPVGTPGEVLVRGPNVMRGYLGLPHETAAAVRAGWLRTGDIGYLDEDGYLHLIDRKKDMIIRGGENVYPSEIENVLMTHPSVAEAAVVGQRDAVLGEVPVAFVAPVEGASIVADELRMYASAHLARYKRPTEVHVVDALPRNPVGKIAKAALREAIDGSDRSSAPTDR